MALRTSRTSGTALSRPPRAIGRPVYEDFKPMSEWKEEEGADILLIYLPGFMKEQMKVSTETPTTLRVRGDRPIGANKWSRFQEDFSIPENCNTKGIRAKFEGGTLTITMPRKSIPQVGPKAEARTTQEAPSPQASPQVGPKAEARTTQEATSKQKSPKGPQEDVQTKADLNADNTKQRDAKSVQPSSPQKTASESMAQKARYDSSPPKVAPTKAQKGPQEDIQAKADLNAENAKQRDTKIVQPSSPQRKVRDDSTPTPPKVTTTIGCDKQMDGKSTLASPSPQKVTSEPKAQRGQDQMPLKATSGTGTQKQTEAKSVRSVETKEKLTETKISEKAMGKITEKEKETGEKRKESEKNEIYTKVAKKRREAKSVRSDVKAGDGGNTVDSYMQAVKGLAKGLNEERQLMVNMGVAALVIVAIGAYISYSFGSSGKPKN